MFDYMLDTNICIYILAGRAPQLSERFEERTSAICVSTIVLAKLWYGVENSHRREANALILAEFAERVGVLHFSPPAAQRYGAIRAGLKRSGTPVGFHDMMIAAHALAANLTLVTNNRREFDRIPGLRVENWA